MFNLVLPLLLASTPVPRFGSCPSHTSTQGGSCVPNPGYTVYLNSNPRSGCPLGWTSSGNYCVTNRQ